MHPPSLSQGHPRHAVAHKACTRTLGPWHSLAHKGHPRHALPQGQGHPRHALAHRSSGEANRSWQAQRLVRGWGLGILYLEGEAEVQGRRKQEAVGRRVEGSLFFN